MTSAPTQSAARTISNFFGALQACRRDRRLLREHPGERELVEHAEDHAGGDGRGDRGVELALVLPSATMPPSMRKKSANCGFAPPS